MASFLDVNFDWPKCPAGYVIRPGNPIPLKRGATLLAEGDPTRGPMILPKDDGVILHRPLELEGNTNGLYKRFISAAKQGTKGYLEFANEFGLLGFDPKGEPLALWSRAATDLIAWKEKHQSSPRALAGFRADRLDAVLVPAAGGKLVFRMTPRTLLGALQLEFAIDITEGRTVKDCRQCGQWFSAGPGGDRNRIDAEFCSDKHRDEYHKSQKRKAKS